MERTILITGPTHGIGRATALALAAQGHRMVLLCRNETLGRALCEEVAGRPGTRPPLLLLADLAKPEQVRSAAHRLLATGDPLDVLINNAGIVNPRRVLVDFGGTQQEQMFAVNHLGHFLLTNLLLPRLIETAQAAGRPSRIVVVSSEAHALFCRGIDFDDLSQEGDFRSFRAYGRSKLANVLMTKELARHLDPSRVLVNCLHPGAVRSNLGGDIEPGWYSPLLRWIQRLFFLSAEQGAETSLHLATGDVTTQGEYYAKKRIRRLKPWALDDSAAAQLWKRSEELVGLARDAGESGLRLNWSTQQSR